MANPLTPDELQVINKELEEKIAAAVKDDSKWKDVLPELMGADVFVVAQFSNQFDANGNRMLNILSATNKDGHKAIPFFTSPSKMRVLAGPQKKSFNCMKMNTVRLFNAIKGKTALLNPGTADCTRVFTPFEVNLLAMEHKDKISAPANKDNQ